MTDVYEVPVLVKVTVAIRDDGSARVIGATADNECAPWANSGEPCAWEPATQEWHAELDSPAHWAWRFAYQWLEGVDLVERAHLAHVKSLLVGPLRAFDAWPAANRQDGLREAYAGAHRALAMLDDPRADPFKHYLRRMPKKEGGA